MLLPLFTFLRQLLPPFVSILILYCIPSPSSMHFHLSIYTTPQHYHQHQASLSTNSTHHYHEQPPSPFYHTAPLHRHIFSPLSPPPHSQFHTTISTITTTVVNTILTTFIITITTWLSPQPPFLPPSCQYHHHHLPHQC